MVIIISELKSLVQNQLGVKLWFSLRQGYMATCVRQHHGFQRRKGHNQVMGPAMRPLGWKGAGALSTRLLQPARTSSPRPASSYPRNFGAPSKLRKLSFRLAEIIPTEAWLFTTGCLLNWVGWNHLNPNLIISIWGLDAMNDRLLPIKNKSMRKDLDAYNQSRRIKRKDYFKKRMVSQRLSCLWLGELQCLSSWLVGLPRVPVQEANLACKD